MVAAAHTPQRSTYIEEVNDHFLQLWPHRFDYLFAPHPDPGTKPQWQTESRHPLSDRLIHQGSYLYGVRFGPTTQYALIDIDRGSPYHPRRDPLALTRLCEALECLGLTQHLTLTSSDSGGLHLYFPFSELLLSWQVGLAVTTLCENQGFKVMPGWLEVFPNARAYNPQTQSLYNGHRLPLQQGGYLLDEDLQPISGNQDRFVAAWELAIEHNDINQTQLAAVVTQAKRRTYRVSGRAEKFLNDLNAEIALGWTGPGQTNRLLGRVTMRSYVFGHVLDAPEPLSGKALCAHIKQTVVSLPGFALWCNHQEELDSKIKAWARSIENSHYFPYGHNSLQVGEGPPSTETKDTGPTWNERQKQAVRDRIANVVRAFTKKEEWPDSISQRFDVLTRQGVSGSSLYKHKDLWHPDHMPEHHTDKPVEIPPDPPNSYGQAQGQETPAQSAQAYWKNGCNQSADKDHSDSVTDPQNGAGCNRRARPGSPVPEHLWLDIHREIEQTRAAQAEARAKHRETQHQHRQTYQQRAQNAHREQLKVWLASDDPILVNEALARLRRMENDNGVESS